MSPEVVDAARRAEPWALRAVHAALAPAVAAYCRRFGSPDWEDLTNEVMLGVLTGLDRFAGGPEQLRTYAFTVAHHKVVDDLRRRSRRVTTIPYQATDDLRTARSAEQEAEDGFGTDQVHALLAALAPDQREVLLLRVVGDLTIEQVAEVLGKSVGAVKQLQRRGLVTLRKNFEGAVPL